ncbi:acetolactate synthase small subunit [Parashewanella curva]|uniref:Acetolactate synthase small subunit n=1 Tax=Parashewanella curva TaxID=2338552 RepID=A0A3L8Q289_9GAMM|nr:acetolactate synthase small subunit [Parashewanella curva]RLV60432.1 acetolactate synthase small subunit [Parashewanella curva]
MEKPQSFTFSVYTENNLGLLNRISQIFLKRHINVESINASESEIENVHRLTIVVEITEAQAIKVAKQIDKQIEVIKAFYHREDETIYRETALYKMPINCLYDGGRVQELISDTYASIVNVSKDYFVIEKTGKKAETTRLYNELRPFGLMQFLRSGRISVTKEVMDISSELTKLVS